MQINSKINKVDKYNRRDSGSGVRGEKENNNRVSESSKRAVSVKCKRVISEKYPNMVGQAKKKPMG